MRSLRRGTLGDRAADLIRHRILTGDVRPGQRLEPLRLIAQELGIGLGAVREAMSRLKGEGLVEVRHGVGCFEARRPRAARALRASARRATRREAAQVRRVVDEMAARAAARHMTPRAAADLVGAVWERERAAREAGPEAFTAADTELHLALVRASRMTVVGAAARMAAALLRTELRARADELAGDDRLHRLHRAMVDAVENGMEHRAARAARAIAFIETRPP